DLFLFAVYRAPRYLLSFPTRRSSDLDGLNEIGLQGLTQQHGHRPIRLQIAREYRRLVKAVADDDVAEALFQIMQIAREAEDRHDFGGDGDVEAGLARKAVAVPQTRNDVA